MTPIYYTYEISIKRVKTRHLKNIPYEIMCGSFLESDLLPGRTYKQRYYSDYPGHTFKVVANIKQGIIESNEIYIPYKSKDVAFEIITEHKKRQLYSIKLVQVPLVSPEVIQLSSLIGIDKKGILYKDHEGQTQIISLREAHKGWKEYMAISAFKPRYIGNYSITDLYKVHFYTRSAKVLCFRDVDNDTLSKWEIILKKARYLGYDIFDLDKDMDVEDHLKREKEKILLAKNTNQ